MCQKPPAPQLLPLSWGLSSSQAHKETDRGPTSPSRQGVPCQSKQSQLSRLCSAWGRGEQRSLSFLPQRYDCSQRHCLHNLPWWRICSFSLWVAAGKDWVPPCLFLIPAGVSGQEKCPHLTFPPLEMSAHSGVTQGLLWHDRGSLVLVAESLSYPAGRGRQSEDSEAQLPSQHSDYLYSNLFHSLGFPDTFLQEVKSSKPRAELDYFEKMTAGWIECFLERCL